METQILNPSVLSDRVYILTRPGSVSGPGCPCMSDSSNTCSYHVLVLPIGMLISSDIERNNKLYCDFLFLLLVSPTTLLVVSMQAFNTLYKLSFGQNVS